MKEQKTIADFTVEELEGMLVNTKANILNAQEDLQIQSQNRQAIEGELKRREEEESNKSVKELDKEAMEMMVETGKTKKTK